MRMFSTQIPYYDATQARGMAQDTHFLFQHVSKSSHALPRAIITSSARKKREESRPPLPTHFTVLRVSGFTDPHGTMERKQWDGLIERWSHVAFYRGLHCPVGAFTRDASSEMSFSFLEHRYQTRLHLNPNLCASMVRGAAESQWPGRSNVSKHGWDHFLQVFGMTIPTISTPYRADVN